MASFDSATFAGAARFEDGHVTGTASSLKYLADEGTLALSGSEPSSLRPRVVSEQISVDADSVDVTLKGPILNAKGDVKSTLQPPKKTAAPGGAKLPSMLKQDQAVTVTADALMFDGDMNQATTMGMPSGRAKQSIKAGFDPSSTARPEPGGIRFGADGDDPGAVGQGQTEEAAASDRRDGENLCV